MRDSWIFYISAVVVWIASGAIGALLARRMCLPSTAMIDSRERYLASLLAMTSWLIAYLKFIEKDDALPIVTSLRDSVLFIGEHMAGCDQQRIAEMALQEMQQSRIEFPAKGEA